MILKHFDVVSGLLHGGTSSLLAVGRHPSGADWPIDIRDPAGDEQPPIARIPLADRGFSCSAGAHPAQLTSDILDPISGEPISTRAACAVLAPTAAEAEILSTALLVMGRERAEQYVRDGSCRGSRVAWIDAGDGPSRFRWFSETP